MMQIHKQLAIVLLLIASGITLPTQATTISSFIDTDRPFTFEKGSGLYKVRFNYTGENWAHADVAGIRIHTEKPRAILPMQCTDPSAIQPGAMVDGRHIGKEWNTITQRALIRRLEARGFFVRLPLLHRTARTCPGFKRWSILLLLYTRVTPMFKLSC